MKKEEIIEIYINDLETKVQQSEARDNRISMLKSELKKTPLKPGTKNVVLISGHCVEILDYRTSAYFVRYNHNGQTEWVGSVSIK